ncbi:MAG: hypothetical protein GTO24_01280 [candidate division Zixibacteria bacterium]|nr:hypothetical protein [candidate division Zixibacteria bacterium]
MVRTDGTIGDSLVYRAQAKPPAACGDAVGDLLIGLSDVFYLLNYLFAWGDPPSPLWTGGVSCDGVVDLRDVVYFINYVSRDRPPPCGRRPTILETYRPPNT